MLKKFSGVFIAMLLIFFSCTDDKTGQVNRKEGMVDFAIKTSIPQGIKTYASSDKGGASNVSNADYSLRYIMEVWDGTTVAYRGYQIVDDFAKGVTFNVRLLAKDYNFVFWADFVKKDDTNHDLYYRTCTVATTDQNDFDKDSIGIGKGLKGIEMLKLDAISDDAKDAYFANVDVDLSYSDQMPKQVILQRPFGKYRLISTDVPDGYLTGTALGKVQIDYAGAMSNAKFYTKFDASTGLVDETSLSPVTGNIAAAQKENMIVPGKTTASDVWVLAFDYVFAQVTDDATPQLITFPVAFNTTVLDNGGAQIGYREISSIPIQRNKLTTVIGNFFTNAAFMDIIVSDSFDAPENVSEFNTTDNQEIGDIADPEVEFFIPDHTITPTYTFKFDKPIPAGTSITLRDETPTDDLSNYYGDVYLEFANPPVASDNINWDIELPHATVYLNGVLANTLTASVSTSTLHIDKACLIKTLYLNKGNAEICSSSSTPGTATNSYTGAVTTVNAATGCKVFWGVKAYGEFYYKAGEGGGSNQNDGCFLMNDFTNLPNVDGTSPFAIGGSGTAANSKRVGYIFDGKGYSLSGNVPTSSGTSAVLAVYANNAIVRNVSMTNTNGNGITVYHCSGARLENVKILNCSKIGLVLNVSPNVTITGCDIEGNKSGGVNVGGSNASTLDFSDGTNIIGGGTGLYAGNYVYADGGATYNNITAPSNWTHSGNFWRPN